MVQWFNDSMLLFNALLSFSENNLGQVFWVKDLYIRSRVCGVAAHWATSIGPPANTYVTWRRPIGPPSNLYVYGVEATNRMCTHVSLRLGRLFFSNFKKCPKPKYFQCLVIFKAFEILNL